MNHIFDTDIAVGTINTPLNAIQKDTYQLFTDSLQSRISNPQWTISPIDRVNSRQKT